MKKYIVVTNIWGKKRKNFWTLIDTFKEEKEYFDTLQEANEYISLFESLGNSYDKPIIKEDSHYSSEWKWKKYISYTFENENQRAWGYVLGDTEKCTVLKWGGIAMYSISKKDDMRKVKDYLFRGENEIPKDYKWDIGEYEGWLQFRGGDGKIAVGYVEEKKPRIMTDEEVVDELIDSSHLNDSYVDDYEEIENSFLNEEDKEKLRLLAERW